MCLAHSATILILVLLLVHQMLQSDSLTMLRLVFLLCKTKITGLPTRRIIVRIKHIYHSLSIQHQSEYNPKIFFQEGLIRFWESWKRKVRDYLQRPGKWYHLKATTLEAVAWIEEFWSVSQVLWQLG